MKHARILLVEDDAAITTVIRVALEGEGAQLDAVSTLAMRDRKLAANRYDAIITDVMLPDGNGLNHLADIVTGEDGVTPVIVLSAQNTLDTAVRAEAEGAFDYLPKPFDLDELIAALRAAVNRLASNPQAVSPRSGGAGGAMPIVGRAEAMQRVYRTLARVAPTDLSVLILGESGTGKELVAEAIHDSSARKAAPFVAINMAAIPRELIESELFGHVKGAFTGAHAKSIGRFEQAVGGTLFLDEIGDMPFEAQTRLLRVLQSGEYSPVGSAHGRKANVRIIAATNQDLGALVATGRFREDLFYRLNVIPIHLPALRHRTSDIGLLARHFIEQGEAMGLPAKSLSTDALMRLTAYSWPGNVRELSNVMHRLALLTRDREIKAADVDRLLSGGMGTANFGDTDTPGTEPRHADADAVLVGAVRVWLDSDNAARAMAQGTLYRELISRVEQELFDAVLTQTADNQIKAAAVLGINRNTLRIKRRH
ncbi:MAG: sigma-54 dependent transcriptional regulator [Sphingopyxis sp.]